MIVIIIIFYATSRNMVQEIVHIHRKNPNIVKYLIWVKKNLLG